MILYNKFLLLFGIGNPGLGGYYEDFMQTLYNNLEVKIPIWCISHAGHYKLPGVVPLKGKKLKMICSLVNENNLFQTIFSPWLRLIFSL